MKAFKKKQSLFWVFLLFFILAVFVPATFLVRLGYDSYSQKISLKQREMISTHTKIARDTEDSYLLYCNVVRTMASEFHQNKIFSKLPPARNPKFWYGRGKDFLQVFSEKDKYNERISKKISQQQQSYLQNWIRHRKVYEDFFAKSLFSKASDFDAWKTSLKVQVFVWERSLFDSAKSQNWKEYEPAIKASTPIFYNQLVPKGIPFMRNCTDEANIETGDISVEDIMGKLEKENEIPDLIRYVSYFPMQQAFYFPSAPVYNVIWDSFYKFSKDLFVSLIFGMIDIPGSDIEKFKKVTGRNIGEYEGIFFPFDLPGFSFELLWLPLPVGFDLEKYKRGEIEAPEGVLMAIFDSSKAESEYFQLFSGKNHTPYLKSKGVIEKVENILQGLQSANTEFTLISPTNIYRKGSQACRFHKNADGFFYWNELPVEQYQDSLRHRGLFLEIQELVGILNEKTGGYERKDQDLCEYVQSGLESEENIVTVRLNHLIELCVKSGKSLSFTWKNPKNNELMFSTLYPSRIISGQVLFFTESLAAFQSEVRKQQAIVGGIILGSVIIALLMGFGLARGVVSPIGVMSTRIAKMADGKYDERMPITSKNEIGQLCLHFNHMASAIQDKLFQMESVGYVNTLMTHDLPRRLMLKYILHVLAIRYHGSFGLIGFFPHAPSLKSRDYPLWEREQLEDEKTRDQVVESIVEKLYPHDQGLRIFTREELKAKGLGYENALSYYVSPESSKTIASGDVYGLLFLADLPKKVLEYFHTAIEEKNPVTSLCDQAKTVVLKTLLDEIEGDTRRGREIQEGLMPKKVPETKGILDIGSFYTSARGLAGDYFDFQEFIDPRYLGFAVADVSGKGIGPSLFGATSKAYMKILAHGNEKNPGVTVCAINDHLCDKKTSALFLTMFYCVVDMQELKLYYASAGHNKMILLRKNGVIEHLSAKGVPLGLFSPIKYETKSTDLQIGDSIILFTDGVTELENSLLELYTQERFETFCLANRNLDAKSWVKALEKELEIYRDGIFPSDDITYMIIKIQGKM